MVVKSDENLLIAANYWLSKFESLLSSSNFADFSLLFDIDCHWRDLLAFSWHITTISGMEKIRNALEIYNKTAKTFGFTVDVLRTPPRRVTRAGVEVVEAIFCFKTEYGRASGILRLLANSEDINSLKAWTLTTTLDEIYGFEEPLGKNRPRGEAYSRDFNSPNWLDQRKSAVAYTDREPAVVIVGGGQAGLSIAARLKLLGVDTLIVDREERIGDNWRNRYHNLTLHNQVHVNHLPYIPFPQNWPAYIPKDKIAGWFQAYVESMELNYWTKTEFLGGTYDEQKARWTINLNQTNGQTREMHPRHVVMATGVSGIPKFPEIQGLEEFGRETIHSSEYTNGKEWKNSDVLIIGSGTSGHDIAQDLYANGANVTLVQRSPTTIIEIEPSAQLPYELYDEGPTLEDCDLISVSIPFKLLKKYHQLITEQARILDKQLLNELSNMGFKIDFGEENTGWQFKYLQKGGGYYFNVGCSNLIVEGKVKLMQLSELDCFVNEGIKIKNGSTLKFDLVVFATGFEGQEYLVEKLFGHRVAEKIGPIWGFDNESQELRNMWVRTRQDGLWFIAGSFAQCRIFSKFLGLQIKACEEGIIPLSP